MKLPSKYQLDDKVTLKAIIKGVTFAEGREFYNIQFLDDQNEEDDDNPISGIPKEFLFDLNAPQSLSDKL